MSIVTSRLQELYVQKNEVAKIEELEHLQNLRVLELGSNKIRVHISPTISDTYWLYLPCMILRQMRIREIAEDRNVCSAWVNCQWFVGVLNWTGDGGTWTADSITRAVVGAKPHSKCGLVWVNRTSEDQYPKQPTYIHAGIWGLSISVYLHAWLSLCLSCMCNAAKPKSGN